MLKDVTILGTSGFRLVDCGKRLHHVPNEIAIAGLLAQLDQFYRGGWYAVLMYSDGKGILRGGDHKGVRPPRAQADVLLELTVMVNRQMHHDGHWVGVFSRGRLALIWRDRDGDLQFTVDYDEPWDRVRQWPITEFAQRAEGAYAEWVERMKLVDAKKMPTMKIAQGQTCSE